MTMLPESAFQRNKHAGLRVYTLGGFHLWRNGDDIPVAVWGREKALHLFQFLVTLRLHGLRLHKEQIVERLWPELDTDGGDRDFKVALHAVNRVLEPDRRPRTEAHFIQRHGLTYDLSLEDIWIDALAFEDLLAAGNQAQEQNTAIDCYRQALALYQGDYLPERRYEDWSSAERERLQVLALGLMTALADLLLQSSPLESIRLTQHALAIDPVWENAYRTQMQAYLAQGNRPMALKTYQRCVEALRSELDIGPLPETRAIFEQIRGG